MEMRIRPSLPFSAGFGGPQTGETPLHPQGKAGRLLPAVPPPAALDFHFISSLLLHSYPSKGKSSYFFFSFFSLILKVVSLSKSASPPLLGAVLCGTGRAVQDAAWARGRGFWLGALIEKRKAFEITNEHRNH